MSALPDGTVTFLLTDVEGSTALWERSSEAMQAALARHDAIMADVVGRHGGVVVKSRGEGDSIFAVFALARDAVAAAAELQRTLQSEPWPTETQLRVRMALHTGEAELRDGDYFGSVVNRAARLRAVAYGGQILLSQATEQLVQDHLAAGLGLHDLGEHRLRNLERPERIFQLTAPDLPRESRPLLTLDTLPNNLPTQLTSFVGREREIAEVRALLSTVRLLTLVGSGGAGKTRLSLQVAAGLVDRYPDGVWLVELAALADPTLVPQTVAAVLGVRDPGARSLTTVLAEHLQSRQTLLVLDNCEHLVGACAELADALLHASPGLRILATSREALGIAGETTWRVPSLLLPDPRQLPTADRLLAFEAVRLFIERAVAAAPGFTITNANAPAVVQICQRLDGIPLAIELAAVRVKVLTPEQIAARLDDRFRLLTAGSRTALPRQQTLRALVDWSHELLTEPERLLFRRLSVFAGGWTLEAAEAVCADDASSGAQQALDAFEILDLLALLVDKSLVLTDEHRGATRYRLLETLRQYGAEKLVAAGEADALRRRHCDWALAEVVRQASRFGGAEQVDALARIDAEYDNVRAALDWCESAPGGWERGARIVDELGWYLGLRGLIREARERIERILPRADQPTEGRARALSVAGKMEHHSATYDLAATHFEESLTIWRALGDTRGTAICLGRYAQTEQAHGDLDHAWALLTECQRLFQQLGGQSGLDAAVEVFLAQVARNRGDDAEAIRLFQECLAPLRAQGDTHSVLAALRSLGELTAAQGELARAAVHLQESLSLAWEIDDQPCTTSALDALATVASGQGETARAARLWAAASASRQAQALSISPAEQERIDRAVAAARPALEPGAFGEAWDEGASFTLAQAVAYALGSPPTR